MTTKYVAYKDKHAVKAQDLSKNERRFLIGLNEQLTTIEQQIKAEAIEILKQLRQRVADDNDWLHDFEADAVIEFWLQEDDPGYDENVDNILVELNEGLKFIDTQNFGMADGHDHNEFQYAHHPMKDEYHCWLYHCLYDHTELGWANMLRIGCIWVDINVAYQHAVGIAPAGLPE